MARNRGIQTLGCLACFVLMFPISEESHADKDDLDGFQLGRKYESQRTKEAYDFKPSADVEGGFDAKSYILIERKNQTLDTNPSNDLSEAKRLVRRFIAVRNKRRQHIPTPSTTEYPHGVKFVDSEKSFHHKKIISQRTKEHGQKYSQEEDNAENKSRIQGKYRQATTLTPKEYRHPDKKKVISQRTKEHGQNYNQGEDKAENKSRTHGEYHQVTTLSPKEYRHPDQSQQTKEKSKMAKYRQTRKNNRQRRKKKKKYGYRQDEETETFDNLGSSKTTTSAYLTKDPTELQKDNSSDLSETEHNVTREHFKEMYIEIMKKKILQKLGLEAPPNVTKQLPMLPDNFLGEFALKDEPRKNEEENLYSKPSQAVVFASQDPLLCPQEGAKCVTFNLDHLSGQEVLSAELWLYKQYDPQDHYNHTLAIYELESNKVNQPSIRKIVGAMQTGIKRGWIKFDIVNTATFWIDKPHRNQGIQILCKTCKPGKNRETPVATSKAIRPVLVVNFGKAHRRVPRSLIRTCQEKITVCCKETLTVNFEAIGWGEWVLFPKSFESNFCRGSCKNLMDMPHMVPRHTQLMIEMASRIDSDLTDEMQACCSPTKLSGISMMYWINENELIKKDLEGMVVEDCACTV